MLSIIVAIRNNRESAAQCLTSVLRTFSLLKLPRVEFVLVDDNSDPGQQIAALLQQFRQQAAVPVKILQFKQHQHYSKALAYALSACEGSNILFVSHDMLLTRYYVQTVL